jgi:hypothetical protein
MYERFINLTYKWGVLIKRMKTGIDYKIQGQIIK